MKRVISLVVCFIMLISIGISAAGFSLVKITGIKLDKSAITLSEGKTYTLKVYFVPTNTTQKIVKYSTSNKNVALVDSKGKITAVKAGSAIITATSTSNIKALAKCTISVTSNQTAFKYPMSGNITLKWWMKPNPIWSANYKNYGDTPFAQELQKRTGIKLKFLHPSGDAREQMNIMIASGELPDIMEYSFIKDFSGGPELAIKYKAILKLNDIIPKYVPNLQKYMKANPEIEKTLKTDNGTYYCFPFVRGDEILSTTYGLAMRTDWLKDLGLQVPTTIDEWYTVLKAFKEKKNATAPLTYGGAWVGVFDPYNNGMFIGAFGIKKDWFQISGKAKFGPFEPKYKDFLATMAKWYKEGLIDKNFATSDKKAFDSNILNSLTGAFPVWPGSGLGVYIPALKAKDPNASIEPVPYPVMKKGDVPMFSSRLLPYDGSTMTVISARPKNVEAAARLLDYAYSEEGNMFYNFGIEGKTYNMVDGYPKMTDEVLNNPDKLPTSQAWAKYARGVFGGPFVQRKEYIEQYFTLKEQKDALKVWSKTDAAKHNMPPLSPTPEESAQYAKIMNDVTTYVDEYSLKVILGTASVDNFSQYIDQLKKMGIETAISVQQAALDRFNSR